MKLLTSIKAFMKRLVIEDDVLIEAKVLPKTIIINKDTYKHERKKLIGSKTIEELNELRSKHFNDLAETTVKKPYRYVIDLDQLHAYR